MTDAGARLNSERVALPAVPTQRLAHLDGLRGFAALAVVLHHFYLLFYVSINAPLNSGLLESPLAIGLSGSLAVYVFFVLSGYVLSAKYFATDDRLVTLKMALARYPRLALPAFASLAIAAVAAHLGWFQQYLATAHIFDTRGFGDTVWWNPPASIAAAIRTGLVGIFLNPDQGARSVNPALWTMYIEFMGSFMVFGLCILLRSPRIRIPAYLLLTLLISGSGPVVRRELGVEPDHLIAFLVGMAYADVVNSPSMRRSVRAQDQLSWWRPTFIFGAFVAAMAAAQISAVAYFSPELTTTLPAFYGHLEKTFWAHYAVLNTITAAIIVIVVNESPSIRAWLSKPLGVSLGKISFALYLVHWTIMVTVACFIFLQLYRLTGSYAFSSACACAAGVTLSILAAVAFERTVDAPAISFARAIGAWLTRPFIRRPAIEASSAPVGAGRPAIADSSRRGATA